jgi:hypothetical protein
MRLSMLSTAISTDLIISITSYSLSADMSATSSLLSLVYSLAPTLSTPTLIRASIGGASLSASALVCLVSPLVAYSSVLNGFFFWT